MTSSKDFTKDKMAFILAFTSVGGCNPSMNKVSYVFSTQIQWLALKNELIQNSGLIVGMESSPGVFFLSFLSTFLRLSSIYRIKNPNNYVLF